ncbi:cytochrome P450 [Ganoderma leucocontextum]|nr:cytochrome P450 [Ganoderma leucocontextum]
MESVSHTVPILFVVVVLSVYVRSVLDWKIRTRGRPLPPGPKGWPIIGNMLNMPASQSWVAYRNLAVHYGDIIYFRVLGQPMLVLGSAATIGEFFDKHSANTSDRPRTHMVALVGQDMNYGVMPYGQRWRQHRRLFWQHFNMRAISVYRQTQTVTARKFLLKLLQDPSELVVYIRYAFTATILKVLFDIDLSDDDNRYTGHIDAALEGFSQGLIPILVGLFPFLRYVPPWVPGAGFQEQFARWREASAAVRNVPFAHVKQAMERGDPLESVVARLLSRVPDESDVGGATAEVKEEIIKNISFVAIEGGADTTFSAVQSVFLAMSLHPDVQRKAQAELDAVVGPRRLPEFADQASLVYVRALCKEALRWQNVTPMGIPHRTMADDELQGYFVPAGTIISVNVWACLHDPDVFEDPDEFRPERFIRDGKLDVSARDPAAFAFGFGRRICPGRHFAEAGLFIIVASVLHVFDITPPLDEQCRPIKITPAQTDGLISYPVDCRCSIKPRTVGAEKLIRSSL